MGYETRFDIEATRQTGEGDGFWALVEDARKWAQTSDTSIFNAAYVKRMNTALEAYGKLTSDQWDALDYVKDGQSAKFYEWKEVFARLSKAYPEFLFRIEWHGEDSGDWGIAEFLHGKRRLVQAVMPDLPEDWEEV